MSTPLSSWKKKMCIKISELMTKLYSTGRASQKEGSWTKNLQERWPEKRQNEMKLRDIPPYMSQLIQVLHKRRKEHQQIKREEIKTRC
jgi:hypothetical protein